MKTAVILAANLCLAACKPELATFPGMTPMETPAANPVAMPPVTPVATPSTTPAPTPFATPAESAAVCGATLYSKNCATCHMDDGSGVPMMQPPLLDSKVVAGDPTQLIRVLLEGPVDVLAPERDSYSNTMPPFTLFSDAEIAAVLTYVRQTFGHDAPAIAVETVTAQRAKKPIDSSPP